MIPSSIKNKPALFDTCILIDYAKGVEDAHDLIHLCPERYISVVTWLEFLAGIPEEHTEPARAFLENNFGIIPVDMDVLDRALLIRRKTKLKLPDALIYASAKSKNVFLVTRNTKDFNPDWVDIHLPYNL